MDKNININHINNSDKELLKFLETKSYKSLTAQDGNNIKLDNKAMEYEQKEALTTSDNKNPEINEATLNEANKISNYITNKKEVNNIEQNNLINENSEELIYKTLIFLLNLCKTLKLKDEDICNILNNTRTFLIQSFQQSEEEQQEARKLIYFNLKRLLGDDFKTKVLLIKRAFTWLGLNKLTNNEEYLSFLTRMSELGDMLSEDQGIKNEQHSFVLTKEEAKKQRNALLADDNFRVALTNKMHPAHKDILSKLHNLNKIIIS